MCIIFENLFPLWLASGRQRNAIVWKQLYSSSNLIAKNIRRCQLFLMVQGLIYNAKTINTQSTRINLQIIFFSLRLFDDGCVAKKNELGAQLSFPKCLKAFQGGLLCVEESSLAADKFRNALMTSFTLVVKDFEHFIWLCRCLRPTKPKLKVVKQLTARLLGRSL